MTDNELPFGDETQATLSGAYAQQPDAAETSGETSQDETVSAHMVAPGGFELEPEIFPEPTDGAPDDMGTGEPAAHAPANSPQGPQSEAAAPIRQAISGPQDEAASPDDPSSTGPMPAIAAAMPYDARPCAIDLDAREGSQLEMGSNTHISWAARTDVGLVRAHNEDSFLARGALFGVCDGMGGHAAGEVASAIAVRTIGEQAPEHADDTMLGAAVEAANEAVMLGAATGEGKPGMGCTASVAIIEGARMAVAHVGDSRIYLLRAGTLVRVTHDHSYVEELVDAGEITADEARTHPSRSIITRALGSDPDMYADHFGLDIERGDRIIACSDGLSSMIADSEIEALAVSSPTPHDCVDALVAAAIAEGGHDNVTVIVVDVLSDGREEKRRLARRRAVIGWVAALGAVFAAMILVLVLIINSSWYVGTNAGYVGIFQGVRGSVLGIPLSHLEQQTGVSLTDLPEATQHQLAQGISVASEQEATSTVHAYETQIAEERSKKLEVASNAQSESDTNVVGDASGAAGPQSTTQDAQQEQTQGGE